MNRGLASIAAFQIQYAGRAEQYIVQEKDWPEEVPLEAIQQYREGIDEGVPAAIAKDPEFGWVVIQTSGQGPYFIWPDVKHLLRRLAKTV